MDNRRLDLIKRGYSYGEIAAIMTNEFEHTFSHRSIESRSWITRTTRELVGVEELKRVISSNEKSTTLDGEKSRVNKKTKKNNKIKISLEDSKRKI
jgi:hypothetical protein